MAALLPDVKTYLDQIYFRDVDLNITPEEFAVLQSYWSRDFQFKGDFAASSSP